MENVPCKAATGGHTYHRFGFTGCCNFESKGF